MFLNFNLCFSFYWSGCVGILRVSHISNFLICQPQYRIRTRYINSTSHLANLKFKRKPIKSFEIIIFTMCKFYKYVNLLDTRTKREIITPMLYLERFQKSTKPWHFRIKNQRYKYGCRGKSEEKKNNNVYALSKKKKINSHNFGL